jgi:hypothetical protein
MTLNSAIACLTILVSSLAHGATIQLDRPDHLVLKGEIVEGDSQKLIDLLISKDGLYESAIFVDSPGGSVDEAIRIAKIVKSMRLLVAVERRAKCASSCFLIFLAGAPRFASGSEFMDPSVLEEFRQRNGFYPYGAVGLHRPFVRRIDELGNQQGMAMRLVASYLEGELLSRRFIDIMMSRPSNDIYWLSQNDLFELGEYSPEQEEFFIQRCGYSRRHAFDLSHALSRRDQADIDRIKTKKALVDECVVSETNKERMRARDRLSRGWRPRWN